VHDALIASDDFDEIALLHEIDALLNGQEDDVNISQLFAGEYCKFQVWVGVCVVHMMVDEIDEP